MLLRYVENYCDNSIKKDAVQLSWLVTKQANTSCTTSVHPDYRLYRDWMAAQHIGDFNPWDARLEQKVITLMGGRL